MTKTILTTPKGERLIVLPEAEYERLLEMAEDAIDIAEANRIKARIESGEEELIPSEIVNKLIDGPESRMRIWRDYRGMSLADLAGQTGFGTAYLSQIETGKKNGSVDALTKIAAALKVDVDDILPRKE
jgi:DNA-binding Xre family transcriptional regulator